MARPRLFSDDAVLDAALTAVAEHGRGVGVADIARSLGAPTGSLYHRHPTREALLVALWARSVTRLHDTIRAAADRRDADGPAVATEADDLLAAMASAVVAHCRRHPADAVALTLFRHADAVRLAAPERQEQVSRVNDDVTALTLDLARARFGRLTARRREIVLVAVQHGPYALVRPYIPTRGGSPAWASALPAWLEEAAAASARAVVALGEHSGRHSRRH